jgi:hypothetical protein
MNYRKVYCAIIAHAKSEEKLGIRSKGNGNYYERHHILPKSLFPLWKKRKSNIVLLTAREHFFCHQLLTKIYTDGKMIHALWFLTIHNKTLVVSSREYARIREQFSKHQSEKLKGSISPNKGKKMSKETRKKLSEAHKGKSTWNKGKHNIYSPEVIEKIKKARQRQTLEGKTNKGCHWSEDAKQRCSKAQLGCKYYNNGSITIRCKPSEIPDGFTLGILRKVKHDN